MEETKGKIVVNITGSREFVVKFEGTITNADLSMAWRHVTKAFREYCRKLRAGMDKNRKVVKVFEKIEVAEMMKAIDV